MEVFCIAAPIKNFEGKTVSGISISVPVGRIENEKIEQTAEKLEQAGNGQIYFADMSPEKMDRKLLQLAGETGIQLSGVETGETKEMDTAGYVYTPLTLEFVCTDREQAAGFVEKINQEGAGMWIKSLQLEKDETAMKGTMEVVYCHDQ